jgi:hypothetical protein
MTKAERILAQAAVTEAAAQVHLTEHDVRVLLSMIHDSAECELVLNTLAGWRAKA